MRFYASQDGHIVNALPPVDINGGVTSDYFTMKNHQHLSAIVAIGVSAAAPTSILVKAASDAAGTGAEAIGFDYYAETTAGGDTLGAKQTVAATGITSVTANDNVFYVIEVDSDELPDGKPWVTIELNNASGNSVIASVQAILSASRYASDQGATAIA